MQLFKSFTNGIVNVLLPKEETRNELSDFIFIHPRIFWMTFPSKEKISDIADSLNQQFKKNHYYIWNLSEHTYNTKQFNNQVADVVFPGYPCPTMQFILIVCKSVLEWLSSDKNNVAFIHCQTTKGRSASVIACLLTLLKVVNNPFEALSYFCNKLQMADSAFLFPTQHLYIRNFANLIESSQINMKVVKLQRIIISEVPRFHEEEKQNVMSDHKMLEEETFKPYIQIFKGTTLLYNSLRENNPMQYTRDETSIMFEVGIDVTDDLLIRCRHYKSEKERLSVFRAMFDPYFVSGEIVRLYSRDIDFSPEFECAVNFYVDMVIEISAVDNPEAKMLSQLKEDCLKLTMEHQKRRELAAAKSLAIKARKSRGGDLFEGKAFETSPEKSIEAKEKNAEIKTVEIKEQVVSKLPQSDAEGKNSAAGHEGMQQVEGSIDSKIEAQK